MVAFFITVPPSIKQSFEVECQLNRTSRASCVLSRGTVACLHIHCDFLYKYLLLSLLSDVVTGLDSIISLGEQNKIFCTSNLKPFS